MEISLSTDPSSRFHEFSVLSPIPDKEKEFQCLEREKAVLKMENQQLRKDIILKDNTIAKMKKDWEDSFQDTFFHVSV